MSIKKCHFESLSGESGRRLPARRVWGVLTPQRSSRYWKSLAERQQHAARGSTTERQRHSAHGRGGGDVTRLTETMRGCLASVCAAVCPSVRPSLRPSVCLAPSGLRLFALADAEVCEKEGRKSMAGMFFFYFFRLKNREEF